jgi:hypothetical protein
VALPRGDPAGLAGCDEAVIDTLGDAPDRDPAVALDGPIREPVSRAVPPAAVDRLGRAAVDRAPAGLADHLFREDPEDRAVRLDDVVLAEVRDRDQFGGGEVVGAKVVMVANPYGLRLVCVGV